MEKFKIEIKTSALKEIKQLSVSDLKKVLLKIEQLSINPRPTGSIKLSGEEKYRLRVGNYHILYAIENDVLTVFVVKVGHRKDVYR